MTGISPIVVLPVSTGLTPRQDRAETQAERALGSDAESQPEQSRGPVNAESTDPRQTRTTLSEQRQLLELRIRDRQVRAHEQAHTSVGGRYAGTASFTFQRGPDGRQYAIGGEVPIDTAPVPGDPAATLAKSLQVERAALAPADPSNADRQIAARARALAGEARRELAKISQDNLQKRIEAQIEQFGPETAEASTEPGRRIDINA